jgi:hypothetical protein
MAARILRMNGDVEPLGEAWVRSTLTISTVLAHSRSGNALLPQTLALITTHTRSHSVEGVPRWTKQLCGLGASLNIICKLFRSHMSLLLASSNSIALTAPFYAFLASLTRGVAEQWLFGS